MVALNDQLTGTLTPNFDQSTDRPSGRSIYKESFEFYFVNSDLLPHNHGVAAQETAESTQGEQTETLIFATDNKLSLVTWQHIVAPRLGGRTINTVQANWRGELTGWRAAYDYQGRLYEVQDLDAETCELAWLPIGSILKQPQTQESINARRTQKEKTGMALAWFALNREVEYFVPAEHSSQPEKSIRSHTAKNGTLLLTFKMRLDDKAFAGELDKKKAMYEGFSFPNSEPTTRPTIPLVEEQLRLFWPPRS